MSDYIKMAHDISNSKGGLCLSKTCDEYSEKLLWKCSNGHEWFAEFGSVKSGRWCRKCFDDSRRINNSHFLAEKNCGKCLDGDKYINNKSLLAWQCRDGHIWNAAVANIIKGKWCPYCAKNAKKTIVQMKNIAESRGGECLSNLYVNSQTKLLWKCSIGHLWQAIPNNIVKGSWCPVCSGSIGERACTEILKQLTNNEFVKVRPKWLQGLELDAYCKDLNLAVEYNGKYHYEKVFAFQNDESLENIKERDSRKRRLCKAQGVTLVVIDEVSPFDVQRLYDVIKKELIKNNIKFNDCCIDIKKIYQNNKLQKYVNVIEAKGGKCLDTHYISSASKIAVECKYGHIWMVKPNGIKRGSWCPICFNMRRKGL